MEPDGEADQGLLRGHPGSVLARRQALRAYVLGTDSLVGAGCQAGDYASDARPWTIDLSNRDLLAALDGQPSTMAQHTRASSPRMYISTLSTKLTKPGRARGFLDQACPLTVDDLSCTSPGSAMLAGRVRQGSRPRRPLRSGHRCGSA